MFVKESPIIVTHVAKTAGTSLHHYLRRILGDRLILDYRVSPLPQPRGIRKLAYQLGFKRAFFPRDVACIMGHFPSTKYDDVFPNARHAIWFREPAERIVSLWKYNCRNVGIVKRDWTNVSLMDFASLPEHQNMQTEKCAGRPLEEFQMVGVTEHFEDSVRLFAKIFDLQPPDLVPRENVNPSRRSENYSLSPDDRQQILEWNQEDVQLHKDATNLFVKLCGEYGFELSNSTDSSIKQSNSLRTNDAA